MLRLTLLLFLALPISTNAAESVCFGAPSKGRLEGGVQIAKSGSNFSPYSSLGVSLGRTYVHSKVAQVISEAYSAVGQSQPNTVFVYGESGWASGGRIKPHRTHQNGLAVDFMVPVLNSEGQSVPLPTDVSNKFGYSIEFDSAARYKDLTIDFEAIAEHLDAVHKAAEKNGVGVARVIFEPLFIPKLYNTKRGAFIKRSITFMQGQAWVRHDEHYHIDFTLPCRPLTSQGDR
ncbi:MAG TPA: penicillin-insensitive murein endopeptidase [Burkholderiales bacterium]|nr:penicillin-insensitive murein endopeptidase [Burkholderiales bacterium]